MILTACVCTVAAAAWAWHGLSADLERAVQQAIAEFSREAATGDRPGRGQAQTR